MKQELYEKEGHKCWICGKKGSRLEAHEFWEYDNKNHVQKLAAIHHLCDMCHKIKHIGFWFYTEPGKEKLEKSELTTGDIINHFCEVNKCLEEDFEKHKEEALNLWRERSKHKWEQDFGEYEADIKGLISKF